ncbi:MAG: tRNA 2-thiouridine(34) synthase MnmA [Clostridia bacterium]|nr:tRNA 2-thiouridine(34) synthase MnmA [Clostridia bacterium]
MPKRIAVGMSGGVDSCAAVILLLEQGYEVGGVTLCLHGSPASPDIEDARRAAAALGIPHTVLDLRDTFRRQVMEPFGAAYAAGETPNPCIRCNRTIKFGAMLDWALENGYDAIATGHYARVEQSGDRYVVRKAADAAKDQSYVLYSLTQHQLAHTLLPLGDRFKPDLRKLVEERGLSLSRKSDSQDICFVPDGDYVGFLNRELGIVGQDGAFLDPDGAVIGTHRGVIAYTVGQRKGLGVAFGEPRFVIAKDAAANTVTLGRNEDTFAPALLADEVNWMAVPHLSNPTAVRVKTRYSQKEMDAVVYPLEDGRIRVQFAEPLRAITPGQAVVLYQGDTVLGGGRILSPLYD